MNPNQVKISRRHALALTTTTIGAAKAAANAQPAGAVTVRLTAGMDRYARKEPLTWSAATGEPDIIVDSGQQYQQILGFGAAFTDAACYLLNGMQGTRRDSLLHDLFSPDGLALNVCRICIGSSDYARSVYSFDEGDPDPDMARFSIDHDREYILPTLRAARAVNPHLFLFASPWSPPGWMKPNGSMLGGCMQKKWLPAYAKYFTKFLEAYKDAGVPIQAVTVQNEVDTNQDGRMPACEWGQEYEVEFVGQHLGPALQAAGTKIWIIDHNWNLWGRAICSLDDPDVAKFTDGIAWHGYVGNPEAMTRVRDAHPEKNAYFTEGGPDYKSPTYATEWASWGATFTGILRNWARSITAWNLALDENGKPNIGPFDCGGVVTIRSDGNIVQSGQYWALMHFSNSIRRDARRVACTGNLAGISHIAFQNPDGGSVLVLANERNARRIRIRVRERQAELALPADSLATLCWGGST